MSKITEILLVKCANAVKKAAKKDMHEWPPSSIPIYYQPERPQQQVSVNNNNEKA